MKSGDNAVYSDGVLSAKEKSMTVEDVSSDLKEIQYYYAHEKEFARADRIVGQSNVREKADRYNAAVRTAPPVLYDLYVSLYVFYNTQTVAAEDMDYSLSHIKRLNRQLCEFLATPLNRGDDEVGSV